MHQKEGAGPPWPARVWLLPLPPLERLPGPPGRLRISQGVLQGLEQISEGCYSNGSHSLDASEGEMADVAGAVTGDAERGSQDSVSCMV